MYIPEGGKTRNYAAVVEEIMHFGQHKAKKWIAFSREQIVKLEIEAQKKLLKIGKRLDWSQEEVRQITEALKIWEKQQ